MLGAVSIHNELESRYISLEFQDQTELTITLDVRLTGKLELFDCKTGDQKLVQQIGLVPDACHCGGRRMIEIGNKKGIRLPGYLGANC